MDDRHEITVFARRRTTRAPARQRTSCRGWVLLAGPALTPHRRLDGNWKCYSVQRVRRRLSINSTLDFVGHFLFEASPFCR